MICISDILLQQVPIWKTKSKTQSAEVPRNTKKFTVKNAILKKLEVFTSRLTFCSSLNIYVKEWYP